ncbi:MAG: hypothetical protein JXR69_10535 [Candidatus Delongbacteria bacterium]|nr:hypothetical protein [Candidatus Delongbacteria bacterium]
MKYKLLLLLLWTMSVVHATIVVDPNCTINFGASDVYISGGLQIDLVKDVPKYPTITFDPGSRLYFVGSGDADLTNVYVLRNVTVDKPSGDLYINSGLNITGNLDFVSGNLITGANSVTLDQTLNGNLSGESATSYVVGTVVASRLIGTGTSNFGNIGFAITNSGNNLGTATVTRESGSGSDVNIYGSNGIERKWTLGTSVGFTGTRNVTSSWLSNEDNGNTLADLKVWKYEPAKSDDSYNDVVSQKRILKNSSSKTATRSDREIRESGPEIDDDLVQIVETDPKTLGWVEVDGASFNTSSSPRTSMFSIDAATVFTINDALNAFADGSGTEANPYQIATLDQLDDVRYYLSACFIQIANIDASPTTGWDSGAGWTPISGFGGKYDGQGHTISNLFIDRTTNNIGLFGVTNAGSEIKDLGLENVDITGGTYTAGLAPYSQGTISGCYVKGTVSSAYDYLGGLAGYARTGSFITDSYSYADVISTAVSGLNIGAFCGRLYNTPIINCYSTGSVTINSSNPGNRGFVGAVGTGITMTNNFWNTELSGQTTTAGTATGLTTNEMRTLSTFTDATWDFQDESANGVEDIWGMNYADNNAFPFLSWQGIAHDPISGFAGGMGTESEPFLISNLTELDNVRNFLTGYYFLQTDDIDASETTGWNGGDGWIPIGYTSPYFTGSYDGDNHKISNLYFDTSLQYSGLFGVAYTNSVIKNLGLVDIDANGGTVYSGTISGYSNSEISNCFVSGTIRSNSYTGGFLGYSNGATVSDCYSKVDVTRITGNTGTFVAGFIGYNGLGTIQRCYSIGAVYYEDATDPVNRGFSGGNTGTISDSFWDIETSGQSTSGGTATGKSTAEMQDVSTYTATATVGLTTPWDFVGDPNDDVAADDYWNIHASLNGGYPYFEWEGRIPVLAPGNVVLAYDGSDVTITWDAVSGASGYAVYSSDDPYGTFSLDGSGSFNGEEWTVSTADPRMFYFVTATNATKETPKTISMQNHVVSK